LSRQICRELWRTTEVEGSELGEHPVPVLIDGCCIIDCDRCEPSYDIDDDGNVN
jgi:hypothetical protein